MPVSAKKFARSVSLFFPALRQRRVAAQLALIGWTRRPWRPVEAVGGLVGADPVIVDVGASRGLSVASMLMMKPAARIVAFEPIKDLADALRARFQGRGDVRVFGCALSDSDDVMTIHVPVYRGCVMDTLAALRREDAADWINPERVYWFDPRELTVKPQRVDVLRLDDLNLAPDILKIYAQSHEPEVIAGAEQTIRRHAPAIMAPARIPRIDASLRDLGYARFAFRDNTFQAEGEGDYTSWYLRPEHRDRFIYPWRK
ncbi:FkbM family methyltransferase [Rhodoblastus acidophilus]|uniref:FkbM family methyltransferase n=1 Tax=Rhodoblastus acidophilus TaxID=1074 RepID=UPI0022256F67|nr:FkbM family methyltransferase [Rhodoblastus acidophilus]MCW2283324.1 FkbM family methyltransferase [Rhodoblastus acidophilus]MCW2332352.1 FkbM family methyltransferase [Rhodoblastus acidophilus]